MAFGRLAGGNEPRHTSSRRSNDHASSNGLRRSNSFDTGEGRSGHRKKSSRAEGKRTETVEEEMAVTKPNRSRRRRATTGDLAALPEGGGDNEGRDRETANMQAVISALQGEVSELPRFNALVKRGRQAEERMKLWEQAFEREQGAPATMEAKTASTTYSALQTRHKLAASQLHDLQAELEAEGVSFIGEYRVDMKRHYGDPSTAADEMGNLDNIPLSE